MIKHAICKKCGSILFDYEDHTNGKCEEILSLRRLSEVETLKRYNDYMKSRWIK